MLEIHLSLCPYLHLYLQNNKLDTCFFLRIIQVALYLNIQGISGGTIRRELDFRTRVRVLVSTSNHRCLLETSVIKKKETTEDVLSGR